MAKSKFPVKQPTDNRVAPATLPNPVIKALFVEAANWLEKDELQKAETALDKHLALAPHSWPGLYMKALIASQTHRFDVAEGLWLNLLKLRPDYVDGHCQLGHMYLARDKLNSAQRSFESALALDAANDSAHVGLGQTYGKLGQYDEALKAYRRADPNSTHAQTGIGFVLTEQGKFADALEALTHALRCDPHNTVAASHLLVCQHFLSSQDASQRFATARALGTLFASQERHDTTWQAADPERPLRIGVVSGDLLSNPTGYFLETVLEEVSKKASQWIAFSNNPLSDELTARLKPRFAKWHHIEALSDSAAAQLVREEQIDILFDLSGHARRNRLTMFALKPAPIQISWLGYWATTGLEAIDYVIADPHCVPLDEVQWFTEKVVHLPHSRFCFSPPFNAPAVSALPVLAGRPFTFACFQQLSKINDQVLKTWARILNAVPHARLRFQNFRLGYAEVMADFADKLRAAGIKGSQVELHVGSKRFEYLQAYAEVDLVLDTFPYPGGTTTVEALWMGVPTMTLATPGMLGRQGAGLMAAAGLPAFICHNADDYVRQAIAWASPEGTKRVELSDLRKRLRQQLKASPLMDAPQFAADLDQALRAVWRSWCAHTE